MNGTKSASVSKKAAAGAACKRNGEYHMCVLVFTPYFVSQGALWLARLSKGVWHCLEGCTCQLYSIPAVFCVFIHGGHVSIFSALNRDMRNGTKYWRCGKRTCPARVTTEGNELL